MPNNQLDEPLPLDDELIPDNCSDDNKNPDSPEKISGQPTNGGTTEIDFSVIDFHPSEPRVPPQFNYCLYFENLRHSLNILLKKPIKKPFATNSKKIITQVNQVPNMETLNEVHWENDKFEPQSEQFLNDTVDKLLN